MMAQTFLKRDDSSLGMGTVLLWPALAGSVEISQLPRVAATPVAVAWISDERRVAKRLESGETICIPVELRIALGFSGFLIGIFVSAVLILGMAMGLAVAGASWGVSGASCVLVVATVFVAVGALLRSNMTAGYAYQENLLMKIESAITPPPPVIDISSVNALENLRVVSMTRRPALNKIASRPGPSLIHQHAPAVFS